MEAEKKPNKLLAIWFKATSPPGKNRLKEGAGLPGAAERPQVTPLCRGLRNLPGGLRRWKVLIDQEGIQINSARKTQ